MPATPAPTDRRARARHTRQESRERIVAAATELIREGSYEGLSVGAVMERAGMGRTIFYRHFDDLGDLLLRASREAIEDLYDVHAPLARSGEYTDVVGQAIVAAVAVFQRHGPLIRAITEAAASDPEVAAGRRGMRRMFDGLVEEALRLRAGAEVAQSPSFAETARALNLLNEAYLIDAFGREPRVSAETATRTLTEIWVAVLERDGGEDAQ
jgi:AcrR family transcriptional regulator